MIKWALIVQWWEQSGGHFIVFSHSFGEKHLKRVCRCPLEVVDGFRR